MTVNEIQKMIDESNYGDTRVRRLDGLYLMDEVKLVYECYADTEQDNVLHFMGCYQVHFDHWKGYDKLIPMKEAVAQQIPYYLQEVAVGEATDENVRFLTCKIDAWPMNLEIWCKNIKVTKEEKQLVQVPM